MSNPVSYFEIIGPDAAALQRFYAELFGWPVAAADAQYGTVKTGDGRGIDGGIGNDQSGNQRVTVYAEVDDLQTYLDKAERLGGHTIVPPTEAGAVTFALLADPAGNVTGIFKS